MVAVDYVAWCYGSWAVTIGGLIDVECVTVVMTCCVTCEFVSDSAGCDMSK